MCKVLPYMLSGSRASGKERNYTMEEQKYRYTRRNGNIGCIAGLLIGAAAMGAAQMQLLPLLGAVAGAAAGMALGWRRDKREAEKREQDAQDC